MTRGDPVRSALPPRRILVIDDEPGIRGIAARVLGASGFAVDLAATGRQGLSMALREPYDLVLLDLHLPDLGGEELLGRLRRQQPRQAILTWSASADRQAVSRCRTLGAHGHLAKPFTLAELTRSITASFSRPATS
jgi:two-component system response regulator PfeR